jgi:hypothetical protein
VESAPDVQTPTLREVIEDLPWIDMFCLVAAVIGAVIVIVNPDQLSYSEYMKGVAAAIAGAGVLGIARAESGKGLSAVVVVLDEIPWSLVIGAIVCTAGAVIVIVNPSQLGFMAWLIDVGAVLGGTGIWGFSRALSGKSVRPLPLVPGETK